MEVQGSLFCSRLFFEVPHELVENVATECNSKQHLPTFIKNSQQESTLHSTESDSAQTRDSSSPK